MGPGRPGHWQTCLALIAGFVLCAGLFSLTIPVFEAPDEPSHAAVAKYILAHGSLPVQTPNSPLGQEASQPPLYYIPGALLLGLSPGPELAPVWDRDRNPHVSFDRSGADPANRNLFAHPNEAFPYQGDVLGIHLMRLLSVALGAVTVLTTFRLAAEIFPDRPAVAALAAALVGFNPQFVFISAVFNNDAGIGAASAVVLWLAVRRLGGPRPGLESAALGLAVGAGVLMKLSGVGLLGLVAGTFALELCLHRDLRRLVRDAAIVYGVAALTAGWWFARNWLLYGDPLGWNMLLAASWSMIRPEPLHPLEAARLLWDARGSFWGLFGWANIPLPAWAYLVTDLLGLAGLAGLVGLGRELWDRREIITAARLALLLGWVTAMGLALVRWVQVNGAAHQGRLLFPAIAAVGVSIGAGLSWVSGRLRLSKVLRPAIFPVLGCGVNLAVLTGVILPAHTPVWGGTPPAGSLGSLRFGQGIELLGVRVSPPAVRPGETVEVELWWRAAAPISDNWSVSLTVLDPDLKPLGGKNSWPQEGRAPTSGWPVGAVVNDRHRFRVEYDGNGPAAGTVWLALYDARDPAGPRLGVYDPAGRYLGTTVPIGRVRLKPASPKAAEPAAPADFRFGPSIRLVGLDQKLTDGRLEVVLYWQATGEVGQPYNVFFHVVDAQGRIVAQADGPPAGGRYPTDLWESGDVILDPHEVDLGPLPPGRYRILVGLYSLADGSRLPAADRDGRRLPEDAAPVGEFARP